MADIQELTSAKLGAEILRWLALQKGRLFAQLEDGVTEVDEAFWQEEKETVRESIKPVLLEAYLTGMRTTLNEIYFGEKQLGINFDFIINEAAAEWILVNAQALAEQLTQTTRNAVADAIHTFITTEGFTLGDLEGLLANTYGVERADVIAVTETTRAFAESSLRAGEEANAQGAALVPVWQTRRDERVCPICGPLHNTTRGQAWTAPPPAHPWCRCAVRHIPNPNLFG